MKVPPKRKGNTYPVPTLPLTKSPSMKVPPKRKGNAARITHYGILEGALNESPSEKEGKFGSPERES